MCVCVCVCVCVVCVCVCVSRTRAHHTHGPSGGVDHFDRLVCVTIMRALIAPMQCALGAGTTGLVCAGHVCCS
jgi:hypothetical protein